MGTLLYLVPNLRTLQKIFSDCYLGSARKKRVSYRHALVSTGILFWTERRTGAKLCPRHAAFNVMAS